MFWKQWLAQLELHKNLAGQTIEGTLLMFGSAPVNKQRSWKRLEYPTVIDAYENANNYYFFMNELHTRDNFLPNKDAGKEFQWTKCQIGGAWINSGYIFFEWNQEKNYFWVFELIGILSFSNQHPKTKLAELQCL